MRILHLNGFKSPEERQTYKILIHKNTIDSIQSLCQAMEQLKISYERHENQAKAENIMAIQVNNLQNIHLSDLAHDIKSIWNDLGSKKCIARSNEWHLLDSAEYFISNIDRIFADNYDPTEQDILRSRISTTGIIETLFKLDKLTFKMYDVGGQRGERKKWSGHLNSQPLQLLMTILIIVIYWLFFAILLPITDYFCYQRKS